MDSYDLMQRDGLPEALRVLRDAYPREVWEGHENFGQLVRFWMERHMMFRELIGKMGEEAEAFLDRKMPVETYAPHLSRYGGFFLQQLHGHHQIEDMHYFPQLVGLDSRIDGGFEMLEADHQPIDGLLRRFAEGANGVLGKAEDEAAAYEAAGAFREELNSMGQLLERHLTDEEDLVVPVILKSGFDG
ncbi:hemerythrin domain-containing protein [Pseudoruegeria sp. HB172150]|uniref:hemerythrin domain-containing protein n=1 Tax=Pseudoruegeria sp. HB172150 TaxID=2721164 RepID=UPI00155311A1|nr:hemerythrin domain-containing protein [Pseudoruegeria sp. HB172150]